MNGKFFILTGKEPSVLIHESDRLVLKDGDPSPDMIVLSKRDKKTYYITKDLYNQIYEQIKKDEDQLKGRIDHRYDIPLIKDSNIKVFELIVCKSITVNDGSATYVPSMYDKKGKMVPFRKLFHV